MPTKRQSITTLRIRKRQEVIGKDSSGNAIVGSGMHLSLTCRHAQVDGQRVETRRNLSNREYETLKMQCDPTRVPISKLRRCFLYNDGYFQLDIYQSPCPGLGKTLLFLFFESNMKNTII